MTLPELLDCDAATLERMSDEELIAHFKPYFNVTRPELVEKPRVGIESVAPQVDFATRQKMEVLAGMGIDVSGIFKRKRK